MPVGIKVKLSINPMYDSMRFCKETHPIYTEYPIDSARLSFLDFGSNGNGNNIMTLKVKDTFRHGYRHGTVSPMGAVKGGSVSILEASYDVFCEGTHGLCILDPTRTGELIYSDQAVL